jgi:hypothetical protein
LIGDLNTGEYYRQRCGPNGWYSKDIEDSRLYINQTQPIKTISDNGHHVSYPGNRQLVIVQVSIVEVV